MTVHVLKTAIALAACASLGACALWKQPEVQRGAGNDVAVYSTNQLTPSQFTVVQHIWIDQMYSNVRIPTYANVDEGIAALKDQAAAAGGTGLINAMCMDATGYKPGRLLCYGDAIRLN